MGDGCWFCHKPFDIEESQQGLGHNECQEEFNRRQQAGKCTMCGKRPAEGGNRECGVCYNGKPYPNFQGYGR